MLKNLNQIAKSHGHKVNPSGTSLDADIACEVVDVLFNQIASSLEHSNLNVLTKTTIKGMLFSEKFDVRSGIKKFIRDMNKSELNNLLINIQFSLNKRDSDIK